MRGSAHTYVPTTLLPHCPTPSPRDEHRHQRLLAPGFVGSAAHGATNSLLHQIEILSALTRDACRRRRSPHRASALPESSPLASASATPMATRSGSPASSYLSSSTTLTATWPAKDSLRRSRMPIASIVADQPAVLVDAAERHLVDDLGGTRRQPQHVAIAHLRHLGRCRTSTSAIHAPPDAPPRHAPARRSAGASIHTSCATRCGADGRRHGPAHRRPR